MTSKESRPPISAPPKVRKQRRDIKTRAEWAEIERVWAEGSVRTMTELSERFGIPQSTLVDRMREKGIRKGQAIEEYNRKLQEELEKKAKRAAAVIAERIEETREWHYTTASGIAKLTWAEVIACKQAGSPMASIKNNLSSLESAMKVLKMAREERFAVLGVNKEGENLDEEEVPELVINELTSEQIEDMRNQDVATEESVESIVDPLPEEVDEGEIEEI